MPVFCCMTGAVLQEAHDSIVIHLLQFSGSLSSDLKYCPCPVP